MRGRWVAAMVTVVMAWVVGAVGAAGQGLPAVPAALDRLDWLVGEWEGHGWMEFAPGQRGEFRGVERVERRMGGRLVVVEGSFTAWMGPELGEVPVHEALGIFDYDPRSDRFRFRTYTALGPDIGGEHSAEVAEGRIVWGYNDPQWGRVRYTITRTDAGEWLEVGDVSQDDGASWRRFFEMRLARRGGDARPTPDSDSGEGPGPVARGGGGSPDSGTGSSDRVLPSEMSEP